MARLGLQAWDRAFLILANQNVTARTSALLLAGVTRYLAPRLREEVSGLSSPTCDVGVAPDYRPSDYSTIFSFPQDPGNAL